MALVTPRAPYLKFDNFSVLTIGVLLPFVIHQVSAASNNFIRQDDCICPGFRLSYECTVLGGGLTIWRGSAFDCSAQSNHIILSHSQFQEGVHGVCNNGDLAAKSIGVMNGECFSSQLNITVNTRMKNTTIECIHDTAGSTETLIGSEVLAFTTELYPPPTGVHLASYSVDPSFLTFTWTPLVNNCSSLNYTISAQNCGECLPPATHSSTLCSNTPISDDTCIFSVRTDVCGNITGRYSQPILVRFKVVDPPVPKVIPRFSCSDKSVMVHVQFNKSEPFNISEGFDGSALSYTISYSNSFTGISCGSETIPASSCVGETCTHSLRVNSLSSCIGTTGILSITMFATNAIGNGSISHPAVFIIPECDGVSSGSEVAVTASVLTVALLFVSVLTSILIVATVFLLRERARILKELETAKELSTYEEVDLPPITPPRPPASIETGGNIAYHPVSHKK